MADPVTAAVVETKGERTRRRLLEVAVRRFADQGYRATSLSAIAREAGLTPAAAYAYFAGKADLFEAAVDHDAAQLIAAAADAVDDDLPLVDAVPLLVVHLREGLARHRLARRVLAGREPEVIGRLVDLPALQEITDELRDRLEAEQAAGTVRADVDAAELAAGIETVALSLLMAMVQVPADRADDRVPGILVVFRALLTVPG